METFVSRRETNGNLQGRLKFLEKLFFNEEKPYLYFAVAFFLASLVVF